MTLALTLCLDEAAGAAVRALWQALADAGLDDHALRLGYPPHLTLARFADDAEPALRPALSQPWPGLSLSLSAFGIFPGEPAWLWLAPAPSAQLLQMQTTLAALAPPDPQDRPGTWVSHVTLGRGDAGAMLALLTPRWTGPIPAWAAALDLVRFPPPEVLASVPLPA
jgi:2'-5' RNA ligase